VACAIAQHDLKRLLAYHSIENIGIILMGLGAAMLGRWGDRPELVVLGMACAVMHVWNHSLFKALLFLSAGSVIQTVRTREIDRMGAVGRSMPWTAGLFTLGALAICGLPPLNGFVSEFFLYTGALGSLRDGAVGVVGAVAPVLALTGALACACFIKVIGCVFLGHPRSEPAAEARECGWIMRAPMCVLAGACVILGLVPILAAPALDAAAAGWALEAAVLPLRSLVPFGIIGVVVVALGAATLAAAFGVSALARLRRPLRAVTWDCGYAAPSARMQYSSSSVARTLVRLFAFVVRPREHAPTVAGAFPPRTAHRGHADDVALDRLIRPFCRALAARFVGIRQWQTGRIQVYILYVGVATLCLMLLVVPLIPLLKRLLTR
jgi:NADH:ubiquinone oxidoreductase subunit 5 (subunit L)/multisubunit Na+/H+ antiporter MnhA subunit